MKKLLAALLLATCAVPASAGVLHYTLQDVTFEDGGTFTGSFDFETDTLSLVDYNLSSSATDTHAAYDYVFGTVPPGYYASIANAIAAYNDMSLSSLFYLFTIGSLADGGTLQLDLASSREEIARRQMVSGSVTTDALDVPEPAMLALFGLGALGLGLARRRRAA